jgi:hypothetical protein
MPAGTTGRAQFGQMFCPMMGVWVFGSAIRVVGDRGAEKVKVDAVHGLRPVAEVAPW